MQVRKCNESLPARTAVAALAFVLLGLQCAAPERPMPGGPNVILITIDTLRADHLACYGDNSIRTPSIDQLAREGVRFTQAYTPVPITLPAHAALYGGFKTRPESSKASKASNQAY